MALLRNDLTYEEVFGEIDKYQSKITPALERLHQEGRMPDDLKRAWDAIASGDDSTDAFTDFARKLREYAGLFDEATQSHIAEYAELVQTLYQMDKGIETENTYDPL